MLKKNKYLSINYQTLYLVYILIVYLKKIKIKEINKYKKVNKIWKINQIYKT